MEEEIERSSNRGNKIILVSPITKVGNARVIQATIMKERVGLEVRERLISLDRTIKLAETLSFLLQPF